MPEMLEKRKGTRWATGDRKVYPALSSFTTKLSRTHTECMAMLIGAAAFAVLSFVSSLV